jgi:hypothetical protein
VKPPEGGFETGCSNVAAPAAALPRRLPARHFLATTRTISSTLFE